MNPAEVVVQRRITKFYLKRYGESISLVRRRKVENARGGVDVVTVTLPPQQFAVVVAHSVPRRSARLTETGLEPMNFDWMMGMPEADLRVGDEFTRAIDGKTYRVGNRAKNTYSVIAQLSSETDA